MPKWTYRERLGGLPNKLTIRSMSRISTVPHHGCAVITLEPYGGGKSVFQRISFSLVSMMKFYRIQKNCC
jgi:hypothetical protein